MIDDCIRLINGARVIRAYIEHGNRGLVIAKYQRRWFVWRVFRAKGEKTWNIFKGDKFSNISEAEKRFTELVEIMLPDLYCPECGYAFNDQEEGCDACAGKKEIPPATVVAAGT